MLVCIVAVALFGIVFGGIQLMDTMGAELSVGTNLSYSKSEAALENFATSAKPTVSVTSAEALHLYEDQVFKPIASVLCTDKEGNEITPSVKNIIFVDSEDSTQTEITEYYNKEEDTLDISAVIGKTGTLAVSYIATDATSVTTTKTIAFIIDAAQPE